MSQFTNMTQWCILLVAVAIIDPLAVSAQPHLHSGMYQVSTQLIMPHLENNLRHAHTQTRHCLSQDSISNHVELFFPILNHISLSGCHLMQTRVLNNTKIALQLICKSTQVATGAATLTFKPAPDCWITRDTNGWKEHDFFSAHAGCTTIGLLTMDLCASAWPGVTNPC